MARESATTIHYLAETYAPRYTPDQLRADSKRIGAAAEVLADSGEPVRYLDSLLVPGEEVALHVFEAEVPEEVERVLHEAGLEAERISVAIPANERNHSIEGEGP